MKTYRVADVVQMLLDDNVPHFIDTMSTSLGEAMRAAILRHPIKTLLTSEVAIHNYDEVHPERIEAIYISEGSFQVIVNNRQFDKLRFLEDVRSRTEEGCTVCFSKKNVAAMCSTCFKTLCKRCLPKIESKTHYNCHKCPTCRSWSLSGNHFGTPLSELDIMNVMNVTNVTKNGDFFQKVASLDGRMRFIPIIDDNIHMNMIYELVKLSGTSRYIEGSLRGLRLHIAAMSKRLHCDIRFYIERQTFQIDISEKGDPVSEISAYRISPGRIVDQLCINAWSTDFMAKVFPSATDVCYKQVEHMTPRDYAHEDGLMSRLMRHIVDVLGPREYSCFVLSDKKKIVMTLDFDADCNILTMHRAKAAARLHPHVLKGATLTTVLYWAPKEKEKKPCCAAFVGMERLDGKACMRLLRNNNGLGGDPSKFFFV